MKAQRSDCPLCCTLDVLGDKWSLLIIRDMLMFKKTQYKEFASSPEKIPTNILASRLKTLEKNKIITKKPYQDRPVRYEYKLTKKGEDLFPVMFEIFKWAQKYIPECCKTPQKEARKILKQYREKYCC